MSFPTVNPLQHSGISPNGPQSPVPPSSPVSEVAGKVAQQVAGTIAGAQTTFIPPQVFNLMNLVGRGIMRNVPLLERRMRSAQKSTDKSRHAIGSAADEEVAPVSGRERPSEVSLALNLLKDDSRDDRRTHVEEELKARKLNPSQRLNVYIEAAAHVDSEGLKPDDAGRIKQSLMQSVEEIQSKNRHAIRRYIHNPEKLREAIEEIAGPLEKLAAIMQRELRNRHNPDSPHTDMDRVDVPYQALSVLAFANKIAGPEHCWKFLAGLRKATKFEYSRDGLHMKSREVPNKNFPQFWLATSDASAFNLAQSALALSSDLRTKIAGRTRIAPAIPAADIAVLLLSAADGAWGKGMSDRIVKEIVGPAPLDSMNFAKVHLLVHSAINLLPETAWPANRMNAKYELLAELRKRGYGLQPAMPVHSIKEEIVEQEWLRKLHEKRAPARPKKQGVD